MPQHFEYLRAFSFGFYQSRLSFLHSRDPRAKLLVFILFLVSIALSTQPYGMLFALFVVLLGFFLANLSLRFALRSLLTSLPFIIVLALLQLWLVKPSIDAVMLWQLGSVKLFDVQLVSAALLILRFVLLFLLIHLTTSTLSLLELLYALQALLKPLNLLGVNTTNIVMSLQIMLRFLPLLALRMEHTAKSQAARGADWDAPTGGIFKRVRLFLPLLVPLFLGSLRQSERVAEAMLARAYDDRVQRTALKVYQFGRVDVLFFLLILLISAWIVCPLGLI